MIVKQGDDKRMIEQAHRVNTKTIKKLQTTPLFTYLDKITD